MKTVWKLHKCNDLISIRILETIWLLAHEGSIILQLSGRKLEMSLYAWHCALIDVQCYMKLYGIIEREKIKVLWQFNT